MEVVRHDDEEIQVSTTEPNRGTRATVVMVTKYTPSSR
jgi:hypothetical protein